jgi:hypothetical protein
LYAKVNENLSIYVAVWEALGESFAVTVKDMASSVLILKFYDNELFVNLYCFEHLDTTKDQKSVSKDKKII